MVDLVENLVQLVALGACLVLAILRLAAALGEVGGLRAVIVAGDGVGREATGDHGEPPARVGDRSWRTNDYLHGWFELVCFYSCSFLALGYWVLYLAAFGETPRYFYVSDLGWTSSFVFLLMLVATGDARRAPQPPVPLAWLVPVLALPQLALYLTFGDVANNLAQCGTMAAIGFFAIRGLACPQAPGFAGSRRFHAAALFYVMCEFATWTTSCLWPTDVLSPYFVADVCLTASYALMLVGAWKVRP